MRHGEDPDPRRRGRGGDRGARSGPVHARCGPGQGGEAPSGDPAPDRASWAEVQPRHDPLPGVRPPPHRGGPAPRAPLDPRPPRGWGPARPEHLRPQPGDHHRPPGPVGRVPQARKRVHPSRDRTPRPRVGHTPVRARGAGPATVLRVRGAGRRRTVVAKRFTPLVLRYIFRYEMPHLLERAVFAIEALYGDFDRGPFRHGEEQVWIARRGTRRWRSTSSR